MSEGNSVPYSVYQKAVEDMGRYKAMLRESKAKLEAQAKDFEALKSDRDAAAAKLAEVEAHAGTLKSRLDAQPSELQQQIARLQGEIRTRDHRDAFYRHAKTYKTEKGEAIRDDALDALWKLSGYTPEGDAPDDAKLTETIRAAVAAHGFVLQSQPQTGAGAAVAANRGQVAAATGGRGSPDLATPSTNKSFTDQLREALAGQYQQ